MKASLRQIDKAATIINQIKELDAEIIALDTLAMQVADNNIDYTFKVNGDLPSNKKESVLTSDGSLKKDDDEDSFYHRMFSFGDSSHKKKPSNTLLTVCIKDVEMLGVIGVLIATKYERREFYKSQIRELGIEI